DDRADFLTPQRFPAAEALITGAVDVELRRLLVDAQTYIVLVTRGHHRDSAALEAIIDRPAKYIGMIGSKRKVRTILGQLAEQGVPLESLAKVHAPIGLEINAVTVDEIALSIAAELVAVRRAAGAASGQPMKLSTTELNTWLDRNHLKDESPTECSGSSPSGGG
ncbi:MAG TPA: XdhC family protein, partial [Tepidisphaeraceae bacterium]